MNGLSETVAWASVPIPPALALDAAFGGFIWKRTSGAPRAPGMDMSKSYLEAFTGIPQKSPDFPGSSRDFKQPLPINTSGFGLKLHKL